MVRSHVKFDDSDDEYQELATDAAEPEAKQTETEPKGSSAAMEVDAEDSVARDDNVSDMDYLRSKMRGAADAEGSTANATDDSDSDDDDDKAKTVAPVVETKQVRKKSGKKGKPTDADAAKAAAVSDKPTVRLRGLPFKATDDDVIDFFHPLTTLMVRLTKNRENRPSGRGFVDFALKDIPRALKYNGNMMNDRYIEVSRDVDDPRANETKPSKIPQKPVHKFADKHVDPTLLGESGRIFVRNLAYSCTEDELEALMTPFGPVSEVLIPLDRSTKKSKAIGFVTFLMPEHAIAAYQALDGQPFQGRLLHLIPSEEKRDHSGVAEGDDENETFKKKAARKRKAESGAAFNWNTLFLRTDAVAGAMATDYGVTKADILDPEADGSMAVRMALGETHVVAENKRFLRENGVVLDAFDTRVDSRSKTTILVKNTPYETTIDEIRALFAKHGDVGRVIFPPSHTMAVVEMLLPQEARQAFKGLAYRKFKHVPIYLEWAPEGCLSASKSGDGDADGEADVGEADKETGARGDDAEPTSGSTLFVKNLSFDTTEDGLRIHFERVVAIRSVRIATKKNPKSGPPLSMGFAFVEFATTADAMMAVKSLQNSDLDGHKLELKVSTKKDDSGRGRERGQAVKVGGTKLLIRNLPFEANKKELKELCQPFGSIKSIRIPKKFDGEHRGFAFVDFLTKKEAKSAFEALSLSTHLYGRRLVVEWAADDTSLETLQSKTRAAYSTSGSDQKRAKIDETL
jgi:multiple RNA-binding domain-containing protein 1